jgi:hypothetical protein
MPKAEVEYVRGNSATTLYVMLEPTFMDSSLVFSWRYSSNTLLGVTRGGYELIPKRNDVYNKFKGVTFV